MLATDEQAGRRVYIDTWLYVCCAVSLKHWKHETKTRDQNCTDGKLGKRRAWTDKCYFVRHWTHVSLSRVISTKCISQSTALYML